MRMSLQKSLTLLLVVFLVGFVMAAVAEERPTRTEQHTTVLIWSDLQCSVKIDGEHWFNLESGEIGPTTLPLGEHLIEAHAAGGNDRWVGVLDINDNYQKVVAIPLAEIRQERIYRELTGAWKSKNLHQTGRFTTSKEAYETDTQAVLSLRPSPHGSLLGTLQQRKKLHTPADGWSSVTDFEVELLYDHRDTVGRAQILEARQRDNAEAWSKLDGVRLTKFELRDDGRLVIRIEWGDGGRWNQWLFQRL